MCTYIYVCMYTCIYTYICIHRHTCRIWIIRDVLRLCHMRHSCVTLIHMWHTIREMTHFIKRGEFLDIFRVLWSENITYHMQYCGYDSYETRLIHMRHHSFIWDTTHSYVTYYTWNEAFHQERRIPSFVFCEEKIFHVYVIWDMTHWSVTYHMRRDSIISDVSYAVFCACVIRDMTHPYETRLIHTRHDSSIWDTTHSYETWLIHMNESCLVWMSRVMSRHLYETWLIHMWLIHTRHDIFRVL